MRLREANSGVNLRRGQPWMVVTGRGLADVTTPNLISLFIPDAAGVGQSHCYPLCCQGQASAAFCVDILTTMSTDCQTKMREEDRQGDEPPLGKCRGQLSCTPPVFMAYLYCL